MQLITVRLYKKARGSHLTLTKQGGITMKKRLFALFILGLFLVLGFVRTAFPQNLIDIEAERLIKEERVLQMQGSDNRTVSEYYSFCQDSLKSMIEGLRKNRRDIIDDFGDPWISKNPDDLQPLIGEKWEFTYTIISDFTDTITFGETIVTTDEGYAGLGCYNEYDTLGGVVYAEMPTYGRGYFVLIPGTIIDENYFFQTSGNNATGFYAHKSHSTGELSNFCPLTGVKISGPKEEASAIDFPDGDVAPLGNPDGIVNIGDAVLCLRFALGLEPGHPTAVELIHGDVAPLGQDGFPNPDGKIDVADALVILRKALGLVDWTKPLLSEWKASTDFGDLKFTVNSDGTAVTEVSYVFSSWTCGSSTKSGTIKITNASGWPITDRQFTIENDLNPDPLLSEMMTISGTFDQSGTHASGTWQADLDDAVCSGTWQASPISDNGTSIDNDGDGYATSQGDCNDNDPTIHPGATEICDDSKDNDCDGYIDCEDSECVNNIACRICTDSDEDGYFLQSGCGTLVDCNDNDPTIHPGATDICGDGIDQDCSGTDKKCGVAPDPGYWSGSFRGANVSFTVSEDSNYIYDFQGEFDCNGRIIGFKSYSFTLTSSREALQINGNEFSFPVFTSKGGWDVDGTVSGIFIDNDYAKVEFRYTVSIPDDFGTDSNYIYCHTSP
jgi:hypothetical protein